MRAAAYIDRTKITDGRTGISHDSRQKAGLLRTGIVNWNDGDGPALWNGFEAVETRINARLGRELRIALPKELPIGEQVRLVRSYCLWMKDQYGLACEWAIHAPTFHDEKEGRQLWQERSAPDG
ncbi:MobA/MobL family protein [Rubellimicrobium rubrum]|uniref:MobA/MobL family protein n=1 Tax=Rubellimicrobium rubrum TaxID=2585369 RepID=UPI00159B8EE9|nr:MobA/MobL family protein [Rubellimicrobium rubrum]